MGTCVRVEKALGRQDPKHIVFTIRQVQILWFIENTCWNGNVISEWILV